MTEPEKFNQRKKRPYEKRLEKQTTFEAALKTLVEKLAPPSDPEQDKLEECREKCRNGNPFPLVAMQWPEMVLTDEKEIAIFQKTMRPERFAGMSEGIREACLNPDNPPLRLDWWQKIIIAAFFDIAISEIYIKGCTGAGKGGSTAMAVNLWYDVYAESRTTLTSDTHEHAKNNIFGEVKMWRARMKFPAKGSDKSEAIESSERHCILVRNPAPGGGESFSGAHGPNTLYVYDEATSIDDILFENCEKNARKIVALANPRTLAGRFRSAFSPLGDKLNENGICFGNIGQRLCMTIGGLDCINVAENRLKQPVAPRDGYSIDGFTYKQGERIQPQHLSAVAELIKSQIDLSLFRNNCARPDYRLVDIFAHGKFPDEDPEKQLILSSWLDRHEKWWQENHESIVVQGFGLDVGATLNGDPSVLTAAGVKGIKAQHSVKLDDTEKLTQWVIDTARLEHGIDLTQGSHPVCIDFGGGYGRGVEEGLRKRGVVTVKFEGNGSTAFPKSYRNLRTEAYAMLARRLDPANAQEPFGIPPDQQLRVELCAPEKILVGNDAICFRLEYKDEVKKKLDGKSPDKSDSAVYAFHVVVQMHQLAEWLQSLQQRQLVCHPQTAQEAIVRKIEIEKEPAPKTEWDDIPFDWLPPKSTNESGERKIEVTPPDKYQREPWWARYTKDE